MSRAWVPAVLGLLAAAADLIAGPIEVAGTAALKEAARSARPGARILLAGGTYQGDCKLTGVKGGPEALIGIVARDPAHPPVFEGGEVAFQLIDCAYLLVEGIVARGASVNNIQVGDGSHHVILKDCTSRDIGGEGNCDGIKAPGLTDFLFYNCTVANWGGEGSAIDMVGCTRGLIYRSLFTYRNLKGQTANAVQAKGGTHNLGIYRCKFLDASHRAIQFGGSTGRQYFFQGNYDSGYEGLDMVALGNLITGGGCAVAFVSCTRCSADYNTILNPQEYVVRILHEGAHHGPAGNSFSRNFITYGRLKNILNQGGPADLDTFTLAGNCWVNTRDPMHSIPKLPVKQVGPMDAYRLERADGYERVIRQAGEEWRKHVDRFPWAWQQAKRLDREAQGGPIPGPLPSEAGRQE